MIRQTTYFLNIPKHHFWRNVENQVSNYGPLVAKRGRAGAVTYLRRNNNAIRGKKARANEYVGTLTD